MTNEMEIIDAQYDKNKHHIQKTGDRRVKSAYTRQTKCICRSFIMIV